MTHSRRSLLKGMSLGAGRFLLTPLLCQMELHAKGNADALPSRFIFVVKDSGIWPSSITPDEFKASGSNAINASLTKSTLPPSMAALKPYQNQLARPLGENVSRWPYESFWHDGRVHGG
jgi:hypothetical protein